ncbi:MAG: aminotransferase class I/II-fold pyridoxal phosphate-dependent enzyme, partial [Rhodocyclaceae bacterium]|nr:aminotransferase class I/II-fold pyridoxal phosphate-dependent enzyme [Rhodocyclaceae bacterium]
ALVRMCRACCALSRGRELATVSGIVLAAGAGRRFGGQKLLQEFHGRAVIYYALRAALAARGIETLASSTQIVPAVLGDERAALAAAAKLREAGILAVAIRPPTVPPGTARLRFSLSAALTDAQFERLLAAIATL